MTYDTRSSVDDEWDLAKEEEARGKEQVWEQSKGRRRHWKPWQEGLRALLAGECIDLK